MKNILVSAGVALLVVVLGVVFLGRSPKVIRETIKEVGGIPGNEVSPNWKINGVNILGFNQSFNTASTSLCSYRAVATSTLIYADIEIRAGSSTALFLEIGKGFLTNATTTSLGSVALAANTPGTFVASTTAAGLNGAKVFGINDYLNFNYGGNTCDGVVACHGLVGSCNALFIQNPTY